MKTDLSKILAVSGQSGLFLYISHARNGAIVEALADKKRTSVSMTSKLTSLADISIYTDDEEVKLQQVFLNMKEVLGDADAPSAKSSAEELKGFYVAVYAQRKTAKGSVVDNIVTCAYGQSVDYHLND